MEKTRETLDLSDRCMVDIPGEPSLNGWTLYYDETNYPVVFRLDPGKESGVNDKQSLYYDFILGGIAIGPDFTGSLETVKEVLGASECDEIKSSKIMKMSKGMNNLSDESAWRFLKWIYDNKLAIHFDSFNNFYDIVIEIVDDAFITKNAKKYLIYHADIKDAVYQAILEDLVGFIQLLIEYKYPDIDSSDIKSFRQDVMAWFDNKQTENVHNCTMIRTFQSLMMATILSEEEPHFTSKEPLLIIDTYSNNYWFKFVLFPDARHVFDESPKIMNKIEEINIVYNGIPYKNYEFVDSKSHIEIQISDVLIKILSVVFHYIDYEVIGDCQRSINELDMNQLKCLFYLNELLDISNSIHQKLLFAQGSLTFYDRRNNFIA